MTTHIVKIDCNTFTFIADGNSRVKCVQHTDFSGTVLEDDFPNGDKSTWTAKATGGTEIESINNMIFGLLKNPTMHTIK